MKRTVSILLIVSMLGLTSTGQLFAQNAQTKQEKHTENVKTKIRKLGLGERVIVKVKLFNDTGYQGYVSQAGEDDFVIVDKAGSPHTLKYSDVKSVGGKNFTTGKKIAIGVGIGVGATLLVLYLIFLEITRNN